MDGAGRRALPVTWRPARYMVAGPCEPREVLGYTHAGLGLHMIHKGSPKGRRPPVWAITHLNTGHRVCGITAHAPVAFSNATAFAELTDWDFDGLKGWKNRDPELGAKVGKLCTTLPGVSSVKTGAANEAQANAISTARA